MILVKHVFFHTFFKSEFCLCFLFFIDVRMEEKEDTAGIEIKKTISRRSATPDNSITEQATDDLWKQMWFRQEPDKDGYFSLQLGKQIERKDMFLTAEDASSLTIARKLCLFEISYIGHFKTNSVN